MIGDAVRLMDEKGISQIPVFGQGKIKALVSEKSLLLPVYQGQYKLTDSINLVYQSKFKMIDRNELLSKVTDALLAKEVVLVTGKDNTVVDILTDIDILHYISLKGSY